MTPKSIARELAFRVAPHAMNKRYIHRHNHESEISLLSALVPRDMLAIDVGANRGLYIHHISKFSQQVAGFEPLPPMIAWLRRIYGGSVDLYQIALSDSAGEATIRYPRENYSWATMAVSNELEQNDSTIPIVSTTVEVRTLDSFEFSNVGFIKIDVEGHEESVLLGAKKTLASMLTCLLRLKRGTILAPHVAFLKI